MKALRILFSAYFIVCLWTLPVFARGETLRVSASRQSIAVGDTVVVSISVASPSQSMNAVSGTLVYPGSLSLETISRQGSIISFWTQEARSSSGKIPFEGVVVNPGYQGSTGTVFTATFVAKKEGVARFYFSEGAILANDGLGTNILETLGSVSITITAASGQNDQERIPVSITGPISRGLRTVALPVITDYSQFVTPEGKAYIKGKGEPNAVTKLVFNDIAQKSLGERFIEFLQPKKKKLDAVLVKNDPKGEFVYESTSDLIAGTYNTTPFLVDTETQTERPGLGVQLFVNDSPVVKFLVVLINILGLLIPIVGLVVVIYFIPWYSWRRMRVIRRRLGLEEEKLELSEHQLKRQDTLLDRALVEDK